MNFYMIFVVLIIVLFFIYKLKKIKERKINEYDNSVVHNGATTIISSDGIYLDGKFTSNEELKDQDERENFIKEQEEIIDLEYEQIKEEMEDYLSKKTTE